MKDLTNKIVYCVEIRRRGEDLATGKNTKKGAYFVNFFFWSSYLSKKYYLILPINI